MEAMLIFLLGSAGLGAFVKSRALSIWLAAALAMALTAMLWLTGKV